MPAPYDDLNSDPLNPEDFDPTYDLDPGIGTDFAKLILKGTSTTNPRRPRTIAAGYDSKKQIMTVVFRDNTWWNYYEVPQNVWDGFTASHSKGEFLFKNGFDSGEYDMGPVNRATQSSRQLTMLDWVVKQSREVQYHSQGLQAYGDVRRPESFATEDLSPQFREGQ
jgi:hypothetical protein